MTLLELYEKLCTGEIKMEDYWGRQGLCWSIELFISISPKCDFVDIMMEGKYGRWLDDPGVMTPERETFLLLFAAYKGEL